MLMPHDRSNAILIRDPAQDGWLLFCDPIEILLANIVIELGGVCYTPPVTYGLLAGTYRACLLEQGQVQERVLWLTDLQSDHRLYLINLVRKQRQAVAHLYP